jgi:hypothetical protein
MKLTDAIKEMSEAESLALIAQVVEHLAERVQLKTGPKGDRGEAGHTPTREQLVPLILETVAETYRGPAGKDGKDGRDGPSPADVNMIIHAMFYKPDGTPEHHFQGPRGETGRPGRDGVNGANGATGPQGPCGVGSPGPRGEEGRAPTKDDLKTLIREVLNENVERFRGVPGRDGANSTIPGPEGKAGAPGRDGLTEGQIRTLIENVLMSEVAQQAATTKLVAIQQEIADISADSNYARVAMQRDHIVKRLIRWFKS